MTFRSVVIPTKAIVLNLLSVGAAYGVLELDLPGRRLERLLGFTSPAAIMSWLPLFLFVVLFGLSMDYHVFILSRIREVRRPRAADATTRSRTGSGDRRRGDQRRRRHGRGVLHLRQPRALAFKQFGVGLAVAILSTRRSCAACCCRRR